MLQETIAEYSDVVNCSDEDGTVRHTLSSDVLDRPDKQAEPKSHKTRLRLKEAEARLSGLKPGLSPKDLPPITYWREAFNLGATPAMVLFRFQLDFQHGWLFPFLRPEHRFVARSAAEWQYFSGVTENEWHTALGKISHLVEHKAYVLGRSKQTWLRPKQEFLDVFGSCLADYDTVGRIHNEQSRRGRPQKGKGAPKDFVLSPDDAAAIERWTAAGGYWK